MASAHPSPVDVEDLRRDVDAALSRHVDGLAHELASISPDAAPLVAALRTMVTGGKRMRAALCYWSWRAHRGAAPDRDAVVRIGAALELFQAAALFHDDVMDASDTRRGEPAAHRAFAARHRDARWTGSAERFGESAAILLGDLALIACERELAAALVGLPADVVARARAVVDTMRTEVTVGQYLDVLAQALPWDGDADAVEARARAVARAKSARYSVEHPLVLGAALAGAPEESLERCRRIGLPLGEAFQLRDDQLGVFGDPSTTGKPAGDDLREGKRTVLVARALRRGGPATERLLARHLGDRGLTEPALGRVREALVASGAATEVEALIAELAGPALAELESAPLADPGRAMLVRLGRALVERRA